MTKGSGTKARANCATCSENVAEKSRICTVLGKPLIRKEGKRGKKERKTRYKNRRRDARKEASKYRYQIPWVIQGDVNIHPPLLSSDALAPYFSHFSSYLFIRFDCSPMFEDPSSTMKSASSSTKRLMSFVGNAPLFIRSSTFPGVPITIGSVIRRGT